MKSLNYVIKYKILVFQYDFYTIVIWKNKRCVDIVCLIMYAFAYS